MFKYITLHSRYFTLCRKRKNKTFLLSTQNQAQQIIIGIGRVILEIEFLSLVNRMALKNVDKVFSVSRKTGLIFFPFWKNKTSEQAYSSRIMLNLTPENLLLSK